MTNEEYLKSLSTEDFLQVIMPTDLRCELCWARDFCAEHDFDKTVYCIDIVRMWLESPKRFKEEIK